MKSQVKAVQPIPLLLLAWTALSALFLLNFGISLYLNSNSSFLGIDITNHSLWLLTRTLAARQIMLGVGLIWVTIWRKPMPFIVVLTLLSVVAVQDIAISVADPLFAVPSEAFNQAMFAVFSLVVNLVGIYSIRKRM